MEGEAEVRQLNIDDPVRVLIVVLTLNFRDPQEGQVEGRVADPAQEVVTQKVKTQSWRMGRHVLYHRLGSRRVRFKGESQSLDSTGWSPVH